MKNTLLILVAMIMGFSVMAQDMTLEQLKAERDTKKAELDAIQGDINALQGKIDKWPGWRIGAVGIIGLDLNGNSDWVRIDNPDSRSTGYGLNVVAFANKIEEKYFWNNTLTFNIKQIDSKVDADSEATKATTDALDIASLFGYKLSEKWAISAEVKYTSTLLNLNDPGKLLVSAGVTWTPIENLVVNIHPLGYEKNWPGTLVSSPGAKIGATYANTSLVPGVAWTSSLNMFIPYSSGEADFNGDDVIDEVYSQGDLVNWTWVNGFSFSVVKGIGVGINVGLSKDKQLADNWRFTNPSLIGLVPDANPIQVYYTVGLSYTL